MWSDAYCYIGECYRDSKPEAYMLYGPDMDETFGKSVTGLIWPDGYVAAGSFWNFDDKFN